MSKQVFFYNHLSVLFRSNFHTTCHAPLQQQGRFMKKVLGNTKKKKSHYYESPVTIHDAFMKTPKGGIHTNPRRVVVLNKLFMRNITDVMSTEEYSSQILGLGVEINKVKITPDYKILKVYWTSAIQHQDKAEEILLTNAGLLRHELSQLRLMGNVPIIHFVRDKNYADFVELNRRLAIADYGEEGPSNTDPSAHLISEFELSMSIDDDVKEQLLKLERDDIDEINETELPPMTNCVFNLDHDNIMNKIRKGHKKNYIDSDRAVDEKWASFKLNQCSNTDPVILGNLKEQREAFNKFLQQRQILKKKFKELQNENLDTEYILEEHEYHKKNFEMSEFDEDFIVEDADEQDR